jgi:hypothetical protein
MADIQPHDDEFLNAFNDEGAGAGSDAGDDDFAQAMGAEPVAVVIEAQVAPDARAAEEQGNAQAAQEAREVNDEANAAAASCALPTSTGSEEAAQQSADSGVPQEGSPQEEAAESPGTEAGEQKLEKSPEATPEASEYDLDDTSDVPPEDMQRAKSWMGRLKKIEAQLKAKQAALDAQGQGAQPDDDGDGQETVASDALEQVADQAQDAGKGDLAQAASAAADKVESGEITSDQAMQQLAEDFGQPFVDMIAAVARMVASQSAKDAVAPVAQGHTDLVSALSDRFAREHAESINSEHPDAMELANSPDFKAYVGSQPNGQQIVDSGSARQINKLLSDYKAQKAPTAAPPAQPDVQASAPAQPAAGPSAQDVDAATAVRSKGLRIPDQPARSDDYEQAWNEF